MSTLDLIVIGGGTAGLVASIGAAGLGARVVLVERERTGGDCLWTGCVPSKALIAAARRAHDLRTADQVGLAPVEPSIELGRILRHVHGARDDLAHHDAPERLRRDGVDVRSGVATLRPDRRVEVRSSDGGREVLRGRSILLATGSRPAIPAIPGLGGAAPLTSETLWDLDRLPGRLLVLGGGATGCELAQAFARLGSDVAIVEALPHLLDDHGPSARRAADAALTDDGVEVRTGTEVTAVEASTGGAGTAVTTSGDRLAFDRLLVAAGRRPGTDGLGLADAGVRTDAEGWVVVDDRLRTSARRVFAAGDVIGGRQLTSVAALEGGMVITDALFGVPRRASRHTVPTVVFTDPEIATVGLRETEARARHDRVTVARATYADLDRGVTHRATDGSVELVADGKGRLLGATVIGEAAGETIAELAVWLRHDGRISDLAQAVHAYPTFSEAPNRAALGHVQRTLLTPRTRRLTRPILALLRWLDRG